MDDARMGQIALVAFRNLLKKDGVCITPSLLRQVIGSARVVCSSADEAEEFAKRIVREMVEDLLANKPNIQQNESSR